MINSWRLSLGVLALLAGALLAACGGGDGNGDGGNGDADGPTGVEDVDGDQNGDDGSTDDSDGDASADLQRLAGEFGAEEVKITYRFSSSFDGESMDGTMTLFWKPPDAWRVDLSFEGADISIITTGDKSYLCSAEGGDGQCLESPVEQALPIPFLSFFTEPDALNDLIGETAGLDIERSSRDIGGESASCFSAAGVIDGEEGSAEYCFSDRGILLLLRAAGGAGEEFSIEATEIENEVDSDDLEPPYPVLEIPIP